MKNLLSYYYNMDIDTINDKEDDVLHFYIDYQEYYFVKFKRPITDLIAIYKLINSYKNKYHHIISNKFGYIYTNYNKENYVLLKINSAPHSENIINEILNNKKSVHNIKDLNRTNWSALWSDKIDYIEYQVGELAKEYPLINKTINYYIGLGENAIAYFNNIELNNKRLFISSKRLFFPNYNINFYNPLNIIIDYEVRDIAEYVKSAFYNESDIKLEIINLINKNILDEVDYNLLFARLLYPSYYFDYIQKILEGKTSEEGLIKYVEKVQDYEQFLNWIYNKISLKYKLIKVDWLIKKES